MHPQDVSMLSHAGPRPVNEDAIIQLEGIDVFAVADGMGGKGAGDVASRIALEILQHNEVTLIEAVARVAEDGSSQSRLAVGATLESILADIHREVAREAARLGRTEMATTLVLAMIADERAYIAHVGDSRAFLYRDGRLRVLTEDHSLAMLRYRQGRLTEEEYRSSPLRRQLYQLLGVGNEVDVDTAEVALAEDDVLLLCSDGLHGALTDNAMAACIAGATMEDMSFKLVTQATRAGTDDNVSVIGVRIGQASRSCQLADELSRILAEVFLFESLSAAERLMVAPYLDQRLLEKGERLFAEGDSGDAFYVVLSGSVKITKGRTHLIDIGPGGQFGELCLARPVARSATVTARETTLVVGLSRDRFQEIVRRRPAMGTKISMAALDHVGDRLRELSDRIQMVEHVANGAVPEGMGPREAVLAAAKGKLKRS